METTKEEFKKLSGIDLTDHEHSGVFPYYKNGKWSSISRGKAWQMYAKWLEDKSTSQKETIERLYDTVTKIKNPYSEEKQYQQWAAAENVLDIIIRSKSFQEVKQLLSTTEPKT